MRLLKIAICDDEKLHLENAVRLVERGAQQYMPDIETFGGAEDLMRAVSLREYSPDIAVLDIQMAGTDGITLAQELNKALPLCQIIFLTSFLDFATNVYEAQHIYFVLKNDAESRMGSALEKAVQALSLSRGADPSICVKSHGTLSVIPVSDIFYVERCGRKTRIAAKDGDIFVSQTPQQLLCGSVVSRFIRCHQSFWVNEEKVVSLNGSDFVLSSGTAIPISRTFRKPVKDRFFAMLLR
jgi:DNA-binding LytR/AlgR family response regulator